MASGLASGLASELASEWPRRLGVGVSVGVGVGIGVAVGVIVGVAGGEGVRVGWGVELAGGPPSGVHAPNATNRVLDRKTATSKYLQRPTMNFLPAFRHGSPLCYH